MGVKETVKNRCVIIAGGDCSIENFDLINDRDYVIAADSGLAFCIKYGIDPDIVVGDFDSFEGDIPEGTETVKLPVKKDDTDLLYAARTGLDKGFSDFVVIGGYGSRADQSFAMLQTLKFLAREKNVRGVRAVCVGFDIYVFSDSGITFTPERDVTFSVFSLGDRAEGVFVSGGEYCLTDAAVTDTFPIGVSNRAEKGRPVVISVKKGTLAVFVLKNVM